MKAVAVSALLAGLALAACSPESRNYGTGGAGGAGGAGGGTGGAGGDPSCLGTTADCDGMPGCETETKGDPMNCGGCNVVCQHACVGTVCNDPVQLVAGYQHTCTRTALGDVFCWGNNTSYELGIGGMESSAVPKYPVLGGAAAHIDAGGGIFQTAAGGNQLVAHTCVALEDTTVQCWGSNSNGQLGTGNGNWQDKPTTVVSLVGAKEVATGGRHTCAVTDKGELYCWGANDKGQCGIGAPSPEVATPTQVQLADVVHVSAGYEHTCAVTKDKTLHCWGVNGIYGRLGIGDGPDQPSPKVVSLTNVDQVSAGYEHTCAVRGGAQYCWGNGYQGQLGIDGEFTWRTAPTDASALPSAMFVSAGFQSTASVTEDGKAYMSSTQVRLGNGTTDSTYVPVALDLAEVREIAAGSSHTCALASKQGLLWCWGDNTQGQLGGGALGGAEVLSPQPVVFVF